MVGHEPKTLRGTQSQWRIRAAGINRAPTDRAMVRPPRFKMPSKLPADIETALRRRPAGVRDFEALAPSHRRQYVGWIESAKREETKARASGGGDSPPGGWQSSWTEMSRHRRAAPSHSL